MASTLPLNDINAAVQDAPGFPGSEQELGELLDAHRRDAYNLAYRLLGRPEDAADAVQDGFLRAVRAMRGSSAAPREPERFRSWLLRIVSNVAIDQLRLRSMGTTESLGDREAAMAAGDCGQPAYELDRREQRGSILRALLSLPAAQRAALTLREYQGLSYEEIGEELGLSQAATAMLLFRARAAFRQAYEGTTAQAEPVGCPALDPLLSALLDGELDRDVWRGVDRHLKQCGRCRRELRGLRKSRRLYAAIPLLVPPACWGYAALTGAATAHAAGLAAASAVAAPVAAPTAGLGAASGAGSVLGVVGASIGSKVAAVAVAAGVTVVATMTPGVEARPAARGAADVTAPSAARQRTGPPDFAVPAFETAERAGKPAGVADASGGPAGGPADAGSVREVAVPAAVVAASSATAAAPTATIASPATSTSAEARSGPAAPADRDDRAAAARASGRTALPAPGEPGAAAGAPGPAKADQPGGPDIPAGYAPSGQARQDDEDEDKADKETRVGGRQDDPGPPDHVDGPPEPAPGPPAHANGAPIRPPPAGPPPAAKPAAGSPREPPGPAHGGPASRPARVRRLIGRRAARPRMPIGRPIRRRWRPERRLTVGRAARRPGMDHRPCRVRPLTLPVPPRRPRL